MLIAAFEEKKGEETKFFDFNAVRKKGKGKREK